MPTLTEAEWMKKYARPKTWFFTALESAPEGKVVDTKIHDATGCRNEQPLKRSGNLWFFPDGSMYVYYTPTHWSYCD